MTENKNWIYELKTRIIESDDRILFDEATGCFLSGHYRAAYILSWISIIESLKRKIKLFSNLGDSRATDACNKIEKDELQKGSTDKLIFEESNNCGILDKADLSTINYLWEQRCLFAHPYNKQPEEDEVKHIIMQSIKLVLAKELFYNKFFLTELSENIAYKPFFLPIEIGRIREFAKRTIARTPEILHPFFFKTLLKKVGDISSNQEKYSELRKLRYHLVELFINTTLSLDNISWSLENRVTNFPYECFVGFVHYETWNKIPDRIKEMLISYFENEQDDKRLISLKVIGNNLIQNGVLSDSLKGKYIAKLNGIKFDSAIDFYGDNDAKFDRIKTEIESRQYGRQDPVIDYLKGERSSNFINSLNNEKQFQLGNLIKTCASGGNWKTQYLIPNIVNGIVCYPDWLKAGIAFRSFISKQNIYSLDENSVVNSIKLLNQIDTVIQQEVYEKIFSILEIDSPKDLEFFEYNETALIELSTSVIDSIEEWNALNKSNFELLIEKIKKYFADPQNARKLAFVYSLTGKK